MKITIQQSDVKAGVRIDDIPVGSVFYWGTIPTELGSLPPYGIWLMTGHGAAALGSGAFCPLSDFGSSAEARLLDAELIVKGLL